MRFQIIWWEDSRAVVFLIECVCSETDSTWSQSSVWILTYGLSHMQLNLGCQSQKYFGTLSGVALHFSVLSSVSSLAHGALVWSVCRISCCPRLTVILLLVPCINPAHKQMSFIVVTCVTVSVCSQVWRAACLNPVWLTFVYCICSSLLYPPPFQFVNHHVAVYHFTEA